MSNSAETLRSIIHDLELQIAGVNVAGIYVKEQGVALRDRRSGLSTALREAQSELRELARTHQPATHEDAQKFFDDHFTFIHVGD